MSKKFAKSHRSNLEFWFLNNIPKPAAMLIGASRSEADLASADAPGRVPLKVAFLIDKDALQKKASSNNNNGILVGIIGSFLHSPSRRLRRCSALPSATSTLEKLPGVVRHIWRKRKWGKLASWKAQASSH